MTTELEHLFDAAGRQAPTSDGWNPDDVIARGSRRRNTRRALTAVGALVTAGALVLGATTIVPKWKPVVAPVDGGVTNTSHDVIDGLDFTIAGPGLLHMRDQYTVIMVVKNTNAEEFRGGVGAGVFRSGYNGNLLHMGDFTVNGSPVSSSGVTAVGSPTGESETFLTWDGDAGLPTVIPAGESITVAFRVNRETLSEPFRDAYGWVAAVKRADKPIDYAAAGDYKPVVADPVVGDPNCTAIKMTSVKVLDSRWRLNSVQVNDAASRAAKPGSVGTPPGWTYEMGEGATGFGSGLAKGDNSYTVDQQMVQAGLGDAGVPLANADSWPDPTLGIRGEQVTGYGYVAYNGAKFVQVEYVGTCTPTGKPVSGIYAGAGEGSSGVMSCDVTPVAGTLSVNAAVYCPAGSIGKQQSKPDGFMPGTIGMTVDATPPPATP